jgi:hypothetical protein
MWVPETRSRPLTCCFAGEEARHDSSVALRLPYQMISTLMAWIVLHARCDTSKEIEILVLRHQLAVLGAARADRGSAGPTKP